MRSQNRYILWQQINQKRVTWNSSFCPLKVFWLLWARVTLKEFFMVPEVVGMYAMFIREAVWPRNIKWLSCNIRELFFSCFAHLNLLWNFSITTSDTTLWQIHIFSRNIESFSCRYDTDCSPPNNYVAIPLNSRENCSSRQFYCVSLWLLKEASLPTQFLFLLLIEIFFFKNTW